MPVSIWNSWSLTWGGYTALRDKVPEAEQEGKEQETGIFCFKKNKKEVNNQKENAKCSWVHKHTFIWLARANGVVDWAITSNLTMLEIASTCESSLSTRMMMDPCYDFIAAAY